MESGTAFSHDGLWWLMLTPYRCSTNLASDTASLTFMRKRFLESFTESLAIAAAGCRGTKDTSGGFNGVLNTFSKKHECNVHASAVKTQTEAVERRVAFRGAWREAVKLMGHGYHRFDSHKTTLKKV